MNKYLSTMENCV